MTVSFCIHGHFYQPPREDPWLGDILIEGSAAPMRHWNERILRESYAPLAWARRLDNEGHIVDILNCYEWINFNVGPTLVKWMRDNAPGVLERMRQGDANSLARWGHGNAMAQVYHHVIMPLADDEDRMLEVRWAIDDFIFQFGRKPEGMWLAECAADTPSLESLAAAGICYVILAPRQAKAVLLNGKSTPVAEDSLNTGEAYLLRLPSGRSLNVVFYQGGLSQAIAFEGLLRNGESFWQRIAGEAAHLRNQAAPLLSLATDGETYGHHFTFGEMALAYVLAQGYARRDNIRLTNMASYLASNPPIREVQLHEPSSWSCVHGIERWRSDCGCSDGGHHGWNQKWRGPLRTALNTMRQGVKAHFAAAASSCLNNPTGALAAYGEVLANPSCAEAFAKRWFTGDASSHDRAWKLLTMQEQSLAAFASCAWFFDDIARIEPENGLTFALRAMDLVMESGGPDLRPALLDALEQAVSNDTTAGNGKNLFAKEVAPRRDDPAALCLLAWVLAESTGDRPEPGKSVCHSWPDISVELRPDKNFEDGSQAGLAIIRGRNEREGTRFVWRIQPPCSTKNDTGPFTAMADAVIYIRREGTDVSMETSRSVGSLSRPMRDYLLTRCLENNERLMRPAFLRLAAHAASMTLPWQEAQHDVCRPELWVGFLPYLVVECMYANDISEAQRRQVEVILSLHLSHRAKTLAQHLVEKALLNALEDYANHKPTGAPGNAPDDATLADWVSRVRHIMPDMDWWAVQNKVWERGIASWPALARELGFRP